MGLITVDEFQAHIQQSAAFSGTYLESAEAAIEDASAVVLVECERTAAWVTTPTDVKLVVKRLAARLFTNPQQRVSYTGPEGLNFSGGPVRLLTDDERDALAPYKASRKRVGAIRMGVAAWMRNPTAAEIAAEAAP